MGTKSKKSASSLAGVSSMSEREARQAIETGAAAELIDDALDAAMKAD
jgi:hypothetical protein